MELGWASTCVATSVDTDLAILTLAYQADKPTELWLITPPGQPFQSLVKLAVIEPKILAEIPYGGGILVSLSGDPTTIADAETLSGAGGVQIDVVSATDVDSLIALQVPKGQLVPAGQP